MALLPGQAKFSEAVGYDRPYSIFQMMVIFANLTFAADTPGMKSFIQRSEKLFSVSLRQCLLPNICAFPLQVIVGGRNDTNYFSDIWEYDYKANSWRSLAQKGPDRPIPRDHFGGFYHEGLVYIYGESLDPMLTLSELQLSSTLSDSVSHQCT